MIETEPPDEPIDVYFWPTPHGQNVAIMLEECRLPYTINFVDLDAGAQFDAAYLAVSPEGKVPGIVDPEGPDGQPISCFETGAILRYLALKSGMFYGDSERVRIAVDQWLFWQVGTLAPAIAQSLLPSQPVNEKPSDVARLYTTLERALSDSSHLAGGYSIADIACYPFVRTWPELGLNLADYPRLSLWSARISDRAAVKSANRIWSAGPPLRRHQA